MSVVSQQLQLPLLLLALLLAVRVPTAAAGLAFPFEPPVFHVVSEVDDPAAIDKVTVLAARLGAVYVTPATRNPKDECLASVQKGVKSSVGVIYITDLENCVDKKQSRPNITAGRMSFFYDNKTNSLQLGDDQLKKGLERLAEQTPKNPIKGKDEGIAVPLWSIIAVGALVGALMAGNCIFFNMLRQINAKTHPADDKKSGKSASASGKASGGSKRSTSEKNKKDKVSAGSSSKSSSKSVKKSAKAAKKNESCRSSKSLSTKSCASAAGPTSVKVVAVAPPKKETTPLPKDEVATLMQTRGGTAALPERSLDRVRAPTLPPRPTTTVPPPSSGACGPKGVSGTAAATVTAQPRPVSIGPPIVPRVSVIGHTGPVSPFAVLAQATSPLPPASTPAVLAADQTAYSTRSATSVVGPTQPSHTPQLPTVTPQPPPSAVVVVPTVAPSSSSVVVPTVTAPATVSPSVVAPPSMATVTPAPAPPPPISLVPTVTLSSMVPLTVTAIPPPPPPATVPPTSPITVAPPPTVSTSPATVAVAPTLPISPAYSLASTPGSGSSSTSSREKAPTSKRSQRK